MSRGCPTILLQGSKDISVTAPLHSPHLGIVPALFNSTGPWKMGWGLTSCDTLRMGGEQAWSCENQGVT